ncbi:MAG: CoA transferase, partial [Hyphomicrobiaceae bacterium]
LAPQKLGSAHPRNAPYQAFKAKDGFFGMAAGNNSLWHSVCDVVVRPDLKAEEKYANPTLRAKHQGELRILLEEIFETQPVEHWISAFAEAGVPCSPINTFPEALNDPQVQAMGWIQDLELPNGVKTRTFGPALRIDNEVQTATRRPPALGEHNQEVLAELAATGNA